MSLARQIAYRVPWNGGDGIVGRLRVDVLWSTMRHGSDAGPSRVGTACSPRRKRWTTRH
jgi:hypothetical protein